jgi:hypothetical protein
MADQLQLRRGTTAENLAFTGAQGEATVDTDKHTVVVHDGVTAGGFPLATERVLNNFTIFFDDDTGGGSVADAYQLTAKDDTLVPDDYNDGQYFGFVTTNTNTGPATADFAGLGQKNIKYADGTDPDAGDIDGRVTMIYDEANDWLELQRKFQATETQSRAGVRQTALTGPVDSDGRADFIIAGAGLQAIASGLSTTSLLLAYGNGFSVELGAADVIVKVNSNQVFGGLVDNDTNYLYLDYDTSTETITPGSTTLAPDYSYAKPSSPSTGQYWYPIDHRSSGEYWDGSAWQSVHRIFIGEVTTSAGSVTNTVSYAYQGKYLSDVFSISTNNTYTRNHNIGADALSFAKVREDATKSWGYFTAGVSGIVGSDSTVRYGVTIGSSMLTASIGTANNAILRTGNYLHGKAGLTSTDTSSAQCQVVSKRSF